jgi:hypothetical protein
MKKSVLLLIALLLTAMLAFAGGQQDGGQAGDLDPQVVPDAPEQRLTEGGLPRSETVIAAMLTGRVGSPSNFNEWVDRKSVV